MQNKSKKGTLLIWFFMFLAGIFIFNYFQNTETIDTLTYSKFVENVKKGNIVKVAIVQNPSSITIDGWYIKEDKAKKFTTFAPINDDGLMSLLLKHNVEIKVIQPSNFLSTDRKSVV